MPDRRHERRTLREIGCTTCGLWWEEGDPRLCACPPKIEGSGLPRLGDAEPGVTTGPGPSPADPCCTTASRHRPDRAYVRRRPYTDQGIKRLSCLRCGRPARTQWQVCGDGNQYRPLCEDCDVALNQMVMEWAGLPFDVDEYRKSHFGGEG